MQSCPLQLGSKVMDVSKLFFFLLTLTSAWLFEPRTVMMWVLFVLTFFTLLFLGNSSLTDREDEY